MNLCIVNGSIKKNNNSSAVSSSIHRCAQETGIQSTIAHLDSFSTLFTGEYISYETASPPQKIQLEYMIRADTLLFVVPTYYKSMPGALKNFFDILKCPEVYEGKAIGFVASNHKNQDYGARHAEEVVKGLLIFFNIEAVLMPEIFILNSEYIQMSEVERLLKRISFYTQHISR